MQGRILFFQSAMTDLHHANPHITHSQYSMKRSLRIICACVVGLTLVGTIALHILLSVQNNRISEVDTQTSQTEANINVIKNNAPFMTYKRNSEFIKQLAVVPIAPYIKELFNISQTPYRFSGVNLAYVGNTTSTTQIQGKITISGPEDMGQLGAFLTKLKSSIYFSSPYIPTVSTTKTSEGKTEYSFPISLQLTQFNNATKK